MCLSEIKNPSVCARAQPLGVNIPKRQGSGLSVFQLCASALDKTCLSTGRPECGPYPDFLLNVPLRRPRDRRKRDIASSKGLKSTLEMEIS